MKKIIIILFIGFFTAVAHAANVTKGLDGNTTFTDSITPYDGPWKYGHLAYSINGTWSGTVTIQRNFGNGWLDVDTFTSNIEGTLNDPTADVTYRMGIKTGDYTSGNATVGLYE